MLTFDTLGTFAGAGLAGGTDGTGAGAGEAVGAGTGAEVTAAEAAVALGTGIPLLGVLSSAGVLSLTSLERGVGMADMDLDISPPSLLPLTGVDCTSAKFSLPEISRNHSRHTRISKLCPNLDQTTWIYTKLLKYTDTCIHNDNFNKNSNKLFTKAVI